MGILGGLLLWALGLKKEILGKPFLNKSLEIGRTKMLLNFEVGPKGLGYIFGYLVSRGTRDHSLIFGEFLEV